MILVKGCHMLCDFGDLAGALRRHAANEDSKDNLILEDVLSKYIYAQGAISQTGIMIF